jgi:beta-lactamase superfamily II metal-dependent hydrolase
LEIATKRAQSLVFLFFVWTLPLSAQQLRIYHIDVEQASATLFVAPGGKTLLVDSGKNGMGSRVKAVMDRAHVSVIDFFVNTHYHEDHYGGIDDLVNLGVSVGEAYDRGDKDLLPVDKLSEVTFKDYQNAVGNRAHHLTAGMTLPLDPIMTVTCISADGLVIGESPSAVSNDENNLSISLLITMGSFRYFIGGDIQSPTEQKIADRDLVKDVDVYVADHHGSDTSSIVPFVSDLNPHVIIISNGDNAGFHHPRQVTLAAFAQLPGPPAVFQTNKCTKGPPCGNVPDEFIADPESSDQDGTIALTADMPTHSYTIAFDSGISRTFQFRGFNVSIPPTNVAAAANGATASASSFYNSGFPPGGAIDSDRKGLAWANGGGWNDGTDSTFPDWLQVDFAGPETIAEVDVFTVQDDYANPAEPAPGTPFTLYGITAFQVQYWDGQSWAIVPGGNITGNNQVWRQITFAAITTTKIRIYVTGALNSYSRITEVEAYASTGVVNNPPTVLLNAPANNTVFSAPAVVSLSASANDIDGSIRKVEFFAGSTLVATSASLTNPYTATWDNALAGNYAITAIATDNLGATTQSSPANIVVTTGGRINLALASNGGSVMASSSYNRAYPPEGAINGDRSGLSWEGGGGWNDSTEDAYPDWLEVDFNGTKTIQEIDVFTLQDNFASPGDPTPTMTFSLYGITNFQVQYWTGSQWLDMPGGNVSGNNLVWRKFSFSPISTTSIRVLVNGALNGYSRITEVEAYAAP